MIVLFSIKDFKISNILNFKERYNNYVSLKDEKFLSENYIYLKDTLSKDYEFECIQLFSYDAILPFLIKKFLPNITFFTLLVLMIYKNLY